MVPIEIGACTWLGAGTTILKGVVIGDNCVIGANTLLRAGYIPDGTVCARQADMPTQAVPSAHRSL